MAAQRGALLKVYKFSIFLVFIQSMLPWFLWDQLVVSLLFGVVVSILFLLQYKNYAFSVQKKDLAAILILIIIQFHVVRDGNQNALIAAFLRIIIISIVIILKDIHKIQLLAYITKAFAILMAFSVTAWLLYLVNFNLPHTNISYNEGWYTYDNFFFFLINTQQGHIPFQRFSSVFLEPGHLGMIGALILLANRYNIRQKSVFIILIACLLTFSLAAYVLLIVSACFILLLNTKKPITYSFIWLISLFGIYAISSSFNDGSNMVNELIIKRLQYDDNGIIGNNRFSTDFNLYYDKFLQTPDKNLGIGTVTYSKLAWKGGNAGYKVYIVQNGIYGLMLLILFYIFLIEHRKSLIPYLILVIYILSFLQRSYALWESEIITFILAQAYYKKQK